MILIEEFERYGADVVFLNFQKSNENPKSQLLLQMQGMIAEYERSKIMERPPGKNSCSKKRFCQCAFGCSFVAQE